MTNESQHDPEDKPDDESIADVSDPRPVIGTGTPDDARSWGSPETPAETEDD